MSHRIDHLRNSPEGDQAKSPGPGPRWARAGRGIAVLAVIATSGGLAVTGCVNSNLLDPPVLFTKTQATTLATQCGGGKGELPTVLLMCGDSNTSTDTPITLTIYSPFVPKNGADSLAFAMRIINTQGDLVRHVEGMRATPGYITEVWDLTDDAGGAASSGDYRIYVSVSDQSVFGDVGLYR